MGAHKNARLKFLRRLEMVHEITEQSITVSQAAPRAGVTAATACKWLGRYLVGNEAALVEASSRPARSPRTIAPGRRWRSSNCDTGSRPMPSLLAPWGCLRAPWVAFWHEPVCHC